MAGHPLDEAAVAAAWDRNAERWADYIGLRVGRYFDKTPFIEHWRFSKAPDPESTEPFEVPRFPCTLSDFLNADCQARFRITQIDEPRPDEAPSKENPRLSRWRDHAPLVLFVSAEKV